MALELNTLGCTSPCDACASPATIECILPGDFTTTTYYVCEVCSKEVFAATCKANVPLRKLDLEALTFLRELNGGRVRREESTIERVM